MVQGKLADELYFSSQSKECHFEREAHLSWDQTSCNYIQMAKEDIHISRISHLTQQCILTQTVTSNLGTQKHPEFHVCKGDSPKSGSPSVFLMSRLHKQCRFFGFLCKTCVATEAVQLCVCEDTFGVIHKPSRSKKGSF